jgi:hypothetical protein
MSQDLKIIEKPITVNGVEHLIVFESEFASVSPEKGCGSRYFCRTCQDELGGRRHHFETSVYFDQAKAEELAHSVEIILAEMTIHADRHAQKLAAKLGPALEAPRTEKVA